MEFRTTVQLREVAERRAKGRERQVRDHPQPAEIHHLLEFGIDTLEQVVVFGTDEHAKTIRLSVAHRRAGERNFLGLERRRHDIG